MKPLTIQAYAMTFNEAPWIERYVRSALRLCDRCTIFDGGSIDGTQDLARDLGAEVISYPQPKGALDYNDPRFNHGERRNECISRLTGDWIFNMDADEELMAESSDQLRVLVSRAFDTIAFKFQRYNLWCAEDIYRTDWMDWYPWLWKNGEGIHYSKRDAPHEPLVASCETNLLVMAMPVNEDKARIIHYHYVRGWKAELHLKSTAAGIRKDAERLRKGGDPRVARLPWLP